MAIPNLYAPAELLSAAAEEQLAETRLTETPLLSLLAPSAQTQQQHSIQWGARVEDSQGSGRAVGGALSEDSSGRVVAAELTIPDYYFKHHFRLQKRQVQEAAATGKIEAVRDAVGNEVDDALRDLTQRINTALYVGTGTLDDTDYGVHGLASIARNTGTYAGIARATYPRWSSLISQGGTPGTPEDLTVDRITDVLGLRRAAGATYRQNDGSRLVALTEDAIERKVMRKLYAGEGNPRATYEGVLANIQPFQSYTIEGIPVMSDVVSAVDNTIYLLDPSKLSLYVYDDESPVAMNDDKISFFSFGGLKFRMALVNDNHPDQFEMEIAISLQLKCHDPVQGVTKIEDVSDDI